MALFELFIPAATADGFNVTAKVRADSWMQALRHGLQRLGDTTDIRNVIVDITEVGIDVTEPGSGRVFRIRELVESGVGAPGPTKPVAAAPAAKPVAATAKPVAAAPPAAAKSVGGVAPPVAARPAAAPAVPGKPAGPSGASATPSTSSTTGPKGSASQPVGGLPSRQTHRFASQATEEAVTQARPAANAAPIGRTGQVAVNAGADDLLGELFAMTQQLYDQPNARAAANFILDLAMRSVPADSGSVFISDINASDLYFAAARGPKAQEAMKFRVPMGQGIVGFCAQEGVALAVSEVQRDPRFYATISKNIGYETTSIICAPAQIQGRVYGALELINKSQGNSFNAREISVLNFLAHEFADYLVNTGQTGA